MSGSVAAWTVEVKERRKIMSGLWKNTVMIGILLAFCLSICGVPVMGEASPAQGVDTQRMSLPDYYPQWLDGTGHIDRMGEEEIVIEDHLFPLSKRVRCGTLKHPYVKRSSLQEGDLVGFVTNDKGEIVSLWEFPE